MRKTLRYLLVIVLWFAHASHAQTKEDVVIDPQAAMENLQTAMQLLPAGTGKELTVLACTRCHNLGGLTAYKGYWSRAQWLAMVENMVKHGAALNEAQMKVVTDYLNNSYGRQSGQ